MKTWFVVLFAAGAFAFALNAGAQTLRTPLNGAVVDWSTNTYVPSGFHGKRLPTSNSDVAAWVTVFTAGRPVNASGYMVRWYADNQFLRGGKGLTTISFKAPRATAKIVNLQARAQAPSGELFVANIQVPTVNPVIAIQANYPGRIVTTPSADVKALLYFFNVSSPSSLVFNWSANGTPGENAEDPDTASINLGPNIQSGTAIRVRATVNNPADSTTATAVTNLIYQKI